MASCAYCHSMILFGGVSDGEMKFCNENCHQQGRFLRKAERLSDRDVAPALRRVHRGSCPECNGKGPIDVHYSHTVISLVVMTSWNSKPKVCCQKCGRSSQLGALAQCVFLGWWGFPWGLIMTPIQICKNLSAMMGGPKPDEPSEELERLVRLMIVDGTIRVGHAGVDDDDDDEGDFVDDAFEDEGVVDAEADDEYDDVEVVSRSSSGKSSKSSPSVRKSAATADRESSSEKPKAVSKPARPAAAASPSAAPAAADRVTCGGCGSSFKATAAVRGKRVKCPKCAAIIDVPE